MKKRVRKIKRFLKICIIVCVLSTFIILGFFVKHSYNFEKSKMSEWLKISEVQQMNTLQKIIPEISDSELLVACMNKIAELPDSNEMTIRSATVLCYNGIKMNIPNDENDKK